MSDTCFCSDARNAKHDRGNRRPLNWKSSNFDEERISLVEIERGFGIGWRRRGPPKEWPESRTQEIQRTLTATIDPYVVR